MPNANVAVTIKRVGAGLWDVLADFFLDQVDDAHRMTSGGWAELVDFLNWGTPFQAERVIVPLTNVDSNGQIWFRGVQGGSSDTDMRHLRIVAHYQQGYPGSRTGPEYRCRKDFALGLNNWQDETQHPTEIVASLRLGGIEMPNIVPAGIFIAIGLGLVIIGKR